LIDGDLVMVKTDFWGEDASCLSNKKLFLFDMDGTIYEEETVFDGTLDLLSRIEEMGSNYVFITNNSSKGIEDYISKVNRLGIKAERCNFFTSTQAAVQLFNKEFPGKKIYCQGTVSMIKELSSAGIAVTEDVEDDVAAILVGFDTELTSEKLKKTCMLLSRDIPYYATNPDLCCPVNFGYIPDCGSICMMLKNCTGKSPVYIGKPEPAMIHAAMEVFQVNREETVVIGDRLYTDIASGLNAGVVSVCVLTGEATEADIAQSPIKPMLTFRSVRDIFSVL